MNIFHFQLLHVCCSKWQIFFMTISIQCLNSCATNNTFQGKIEVIHCHLKCFDKAAATKNLVFAGVCLNDGFGTVAHNTLQQKYISLIRLTYLATTTFCPPC